MSTDSSPKFCSQCGSSLTVGNGADAAGVTVDRPTPANHSTSDTEMATIAPQGDTHDFDSKTRALGNSHSPHDEVAPNTHFGPYRIVRKLGQGGMGSVFEAEHQVTGQQVALKLLSRALLSTEDSVERFQRESQIAASINHPHSTFVYEAGEFDDQFYITMELMPGGTLKEVIEDNGALPVEKAVDYVLDIIDGLNPAHAAGIVHRDLKPANCFIDNHGRVKIGDFGLAKSFLGDSNLTQTGTFMGTPQFAAPEQLRASDVDQQADLYAVGGTLFYLLTGRPPFVGNAAQVISSIASDQAPDITTVVDGIPKELGRIVQQSLEKDPAKRPENLSALRNALLPFSTSGASEADLGRRMAAFFIDSIICTCLIVMVVQFTTTLTMLSGAFSNIGGFDTINLINLFIQFAVLLCYFAIPEWRFGRTIGKWMMGMRVIDHRNETPRLTPALIRAAMVPGLAQLSISISNYLFGFAGADLENMSRTMVTMQCVSLLSWIPSLICLSTARRANGFRGLHDLLSGTRVVRLASSLEFVRPKNVPVTLPVATETQSESQPNSQQLPQLRSTLKILGHFESARRDSSKVYMAKDELLDRDVWVTEVSEFDSDEPIRSDFRSTQLRTLAKSEHDGRKWIVSEAMKGVPLLQYLTSSPRMGWSSLLPVLQDVVSELIETERAANSSDPDVRLRCEQIWIDQSGIVKILEPAITPLIGVEAAQPEKTHQENHQESSGLDSASTSDLLEPSKVVEVLLDAIVKKHIVPVHVLEFRDQLKSYHGSPDSLRRIEQDLESSEEQPSAWRWDDRLGVGAATVGIECSLIFSATLVWAFFASFYRHVTWPVAGLGIFGIWIGLVAVISFITRGGITFHMTGVSVRQSKSLRAASGLHCAIRSIVSWLPFIVMMASFAAVIGFGIGQEIAASVDIDAEMPRVILFQLLAWVPMLGLILSGFVFSIYSPSRGIADLICGTRLTRK